MKNALVILLMAFVTLSFKGEKPREAVIQTSSECGMCKDRIQEKLNYTKGVTFAELDIPSKQLTVRFKESKICLDQIRTILSELGYDADDVKANPENQKKLPACCQPGGMEKSKNH